MDFRDVRCGMRLVRDDLLSLMMAVESCGERFWRSMPDRYYGPAEQFIHIVQVARFTRRFMNHQLDLEAGDGDRPFELPPDLAGAVHNLAALRAANFISARRKFREFDNFAQLEGWVIGNCKGIYDWLCSLPADRVSWSVSHPLVTMHCSAAHMLFRQFIRHTDHHHGQVTQLMKDAGYVDAVPFLPSSGHIAALAGYLV